MKLATDYKNEDWIKLTFSLLFMGGLLFIGVITYVDSFLTPGLVGFTQALELTTDWLQNYAQERADVISEQVKVEINKDNVLGMIDTGVQDVNEKANQIFIIWIAMGIGLIVPIYLIFKVTVWLARHFDKLIKFDGKKRVFYKIKNVTNNS